MRKAANSLLPNKSRLLKSLKLDFRSIREFYITLDEPHRLYHPGDEVKGSIALVLDRDLINLVVTLSLSGTVKIKNPTRASTLRGISKNITLFDHTISLYGDQQNNTNNGLSNGLSKGEHRFPFIVKLPKRNVFTSISFEKGSIRYGLKCAVGDKSTFSLLSLASNINNSNILVCEKFINIVKPINVARLPVLKPKTLVVKSPTRRLHRIKSSASSVVSDQSNNSQGMNAADESNLTPDFSQTVDDLPKKTSSRSIKLSVEYPHLGYLPGESIPVKIKLQHTKHIQNSNGIIVTLIRVCKFDFGPEGAVQTFRKDLSQAILPLVTDPNLHTGEVSTSLKIPADVFPSIIGCPLVSFQYSVECVVNLSTTNSLKVFLGKTKFSPTDTKHLIDDENINDIMSYSHSLNNESIDENEGPDLSDSSLLGTSSIPTPTSDNNEDSPIKSYSVKQSSTNYSSNTNNSNIFNVDKLKRLRDVITLNSEVVIGTYRRVERASRARSQASSIQNSPGDVQEGVAFETTTALRPTRQQEITNPRRHYTQPPPLEEYPYPYPEPIEDSPMYSSLTDEQYPSVPNQSGLTEKQILQIQENALLPSEPFIEPELNDSESLRVPELPASPEL
ncbi:BA75_03127T0 [Komagataella pastoris]|uniref:pH-response regulator protein palF/RIM8 n=1 Tax=Komagataella pastoris TaxID=4922 RepID=A0A1B2JDZ1_PICPA|nr:BA75_03127T0 [Komagataella pastoris]